MPAKEHPQRRLISLPVTPPPSAADAGEVSTAHVEMTIGGEPVGLRITAPVNRIPLPQLLPIFQGFTNVVVDISVEKAERQGRQVSCCKGCGACCRQLVPVSSSEALALSQLVSDLPEPRRTAVRARFANAILRLNGTGLLDSFRRREPVPTSEIKSLGLNYFQQGVACPFLEEESCSIHPDRPLACREYLVTTPAAECARPTPETIERVPLLAQQARALRALDRELTGAEPAWLPLTLALEWADAQQEQTPVHNGKELVQKFFARLTQRPDLADELNVADTGFR